MASEFLRRIGQAMADAETPLVRRNKGREDRLFYEVFVTPDGGDPVVLSAHGTEDEAAAVCEALGDEMRGRVAVSAMRDLPEDILSFGEAVAVEAGIQRAFQLMIERALKDQP